MVFLQFQINQQIMTIKTCFSNFFKVFDLFSLTQFLRYNQEEDYTTVSGGIISILVVTVFTALFADNALKMIRKSQVTWSQTRQSSFEPTPLNLTFGSQAKSMLAVGILGSNLNLFDLRYFDFQLVHTIMENETIIRNISTPLEKCTPEHFSMTEKIKNNFHLMGGERRVCVPLNASFQLSGKLSLGSQKTIVLSAVTCNSALDPTRRCATVAELNSLLTDAGSFFVSLYVVNPLINPGNVEYLDYEVNDINILSFNFNSGTIAAGLIEQFTIETDESLFPFTSTRVQSGIKLTNTFQQAQSEVTNNVYGLFTISKSSTKVVYKRSFNKLDEFFSYLGGLIGTILGLMLFMNKFSLMSFELDIAQRFVRYRNNEKLDFSGFNIFSYFLYLLYKLGSFCGCCGDWSQMRKQEECKKQILKQLDVKLFLQKFNYLERVAEYLLRNHQRYKPEFFHPETIKMLRKRRRIFKKNCKSKIKRVENSEPNQSGEEHDDSSSDNSDPDEISDEISFQKRIQQEEGGNKNGSFSNLEVANSSERIDAQNYSRNQKQRTKIKNNPPQQYQQTIDMHQLESNNLHQVAIGGNGTISEGQSMMNIKIKGPKQKEQIKQEEKSQIKFNKSSKRGTNNHESVTKKELKVNTKSEVKEVQEEEDEDYKFEQFQPFK